MRAQLLVESPDYSNSKSPLIMHSAQINTEYTANCLIILVQDKTRICHALYVFDSDNTGILYLILIRQIIIN